MQEDQGGPITDRSMEHLVSADSSIIAVRKRLLETVLQLREGTEPSEPHSGEGYRVRPVDLELDSSDTVWESGKQYLEAKAW